MDGIVRAPYTVIDLFAGIGGIKTGFMDAGFDVVFSNDFDKWARITFDLNYERPMVFGDIREVLSESMPDVDVVVGGFPCQPFSVRGNKEGFNDVSRGTLIFDVVRIIRDKKPKAFMLENVKHLANIQGGEVLEIILEELRQIGYHVTYKVLNTKKHGNLPQNRERIFIVGFSEEASYNAFEFPEEIPLTVSFADMYEDDVPEKYYFSEEFLSVMTKEGVPRKTLFESMILHEGVAYQWRMNYYVRENKSGVSPTLTTGVADVPIILQNGRYRRLTPRECGNLQGFPSTFEFPDVNDSHLYKQFGNSVSIPVIRRIATNMKVALDINTNI